MIAQQKLPDLILLVLDAKAVEHNKKSICELRAQIDRDSDVTLKDAPPMPKVILYLPLDYQHKLTPGTKIQADLTIIAEGRRRAGPTVQEQKDSLWSEITELTKRKEGHTGKYAQVVKDYNGMQRYVDEQLRGSTDGLSGSEKQKMAKLQQDVLRAQESLDKVTKELDERQRKFKELEALPA